MSAGEDGDIRWEPCAACPGCHKEYKEMTGQSAILYCPYARKPVPTASARKKLAVAARKKRKAQLWADYRKKESDDKRANFFKPRKSAKPKPGAATKPAPETETGPTK